jgi:hypothetical protein
MAEMPWNRALAESAEKQAALLGECEQKLLRQQVTITNLKRRLQNAKLSHQNWLLRQQAWRHERDELLRRLGRPGS